MRSPAWGNRICVREAMPFTTTIKPNTATSFVTSAGIALLSPRSRGRGWKGCGPVFLNKNGSRDFQAAPKEATGVSRTSCCVCHPACTGSDLPCILATSSKCARRDFGIPIRRHECTVLIGACISFATTVVPPKKSIIVLAFSFIAATSMR